MCDEIQYNQDGSTGDGRDAHNLDRVILKQNSIKAIEFAVDILQDFGDMAPKLVTGIYDRNKEALKKTLKVLNNQAAWKTVEEDEGEYSPCCGASIIRGDLCSDCLEHCI